MNTRERVVEEAKSWIGTPFHHSARLKNVGVDCLMFLAEVYERVGVCGRVEPGYYPADWHLHQDREKYLEGLLGYTREVDSPQTADIVMFKFGRTYSHSAIVVEWPTLIHAYWNIGVVWGNAKLVPLKNREFKFFSPFEEG